MWRLVSDVWPHASKRRLTKVELAGSMDREAGDLPYGHQRLLEVAMGLALDPELLILG